MNRKRLSVWSCAENRSTSRFSGSSQHIHGKLAEREPGGTSVVLWAKEKSNWTLVLVVEKSVCDRLKLLFFCIPFENQCQCPEKSSVAQSFHTLQPSPWSLLQRLPVCLQTGVMEVMISFSSGTVRLLTSLSWEGCVARPETPNDPRIQDWLRVWVTTHMFT